MTAGIVALSVANAAAQGSSIRGTVVDETGGRLPGVTVTISSPAMLTPQLSEVTGAEGTYVFANLPIGTYAATFELAGFQRFVRQEILLTTAFAAVINVTMQVGALAESITVSGASPVVDPTSATLASTLSSKQITETLPVSRSLGAVFSSMPGTGRTTDTGAGGLASGGQSAYGNGGQYTVLIDGINARQANGSTQGFGPDLASMEEVQLVTLGAGADQMAPGTAAIMTIKSGGNNFRGRYEIKGQDDRFQSNNVSDELFAQGIRQGDDILMSRDVTADLGGPIQRDRLWFYGAVRYFHSDSGILGYARAPGADQTFNTVDDVPGSDPLDSNNWTIKGTYQATPKYKVTSFYTRNVQDEPQRFGSRLVPYEATRRFLWTIHQAKVELQGNPSNRLLFSVQMGRNYYTADYFVKEEFAHLPSSFDNTSRLTLGPATAQDKRPRSNYQPSGWVQFIPEGSFIGRHEFKAGFSWYHEYVSTYYPNGVHGNYQLVFDTINDVPRQAFQIRTYNYPLTYFDRLDTSGLYAQDQWQVSRRLTVNLGLRYDGQHSWVPPQTKEQGPFGNAGSFPEVEVGVWRTLAPRVAVAFDLTGDGKTVVKGSYGRFNHQLGDNFSNAYNQNTLLTTTYRWHDRNGNADYDAGEVNLDISDPDNDDFVNISGATNNILNPDLRLPYSIQAIASVERELLPNFGAKVSYIYFRDHDLYETYNVLRPYDAYTVQIPRQDPGADGTLGTGDDGSTVIVYDYPTAMRGSTFVGNKRLNRENQFDDSTQVLEVALTRRTVGRWGLMASGNVLFNHNWAAGIPQSPNDEYFNLNTTRDWQAKVTGNYDFPLGIATSASAVILNPVTLQRTNLFRNIPSASTVTLRMEERNRNLSKPRTSFNARVAKFFSLQRFGRVGLTLEVFNVLNTSTAGSFSVASGQTYGEIQSIDNPRILRFGALFEF